jgi:hypothetical protein
MPVTDGGKLGAFALALERNTHFIALTDNADMFPVATEWMSLAFPEDAKRYSDLASQVRLDVMRARTDHAAEMHGWLW